MLRIEPLHPLFAGRVLGVHLGRGPVPEAEMGAIREAFDRLSVLVFPDQAGLDDAAQVAFSRRLGPLEATRAGANGAGQPADPHDQHRPGRRHRAADGPAGAERPGEPRLAPRQQLQAGARARLPALGAGGPGGGGRHRVRSCRAAWAALPGDLRRRVRGRVAVHDFGWSRARVSPDLVTEEERAAWPPVRQAVVLEEGRHGASLYLGAHARAVEGMAEAEGRALIKALMAFATQERFV
jgi:alpha-ketoglutarate-dependent 2,4-dichlorophenoxyacetate dioxygenase